MGHRWRQGALVVGLLGLGSLLCLGAGAWLLRQPVVLEGPLCFDLKPGAAGPQLQTVLKADSGPAERFALRLYLRLSGVGRVLQAGEYCLASGETFLSTLGKLRSGAVHERTLRIGEGWTLRDLEKALRAAERLDRTGLGPSWPERAAQLSLRGSLEGRFFPDSYRYVAGTSALTLLAQAAARMDEALRKVWEGRDQDLPLSTPGELLTLASLIEKETGFASDRPRVSRVFHNRLREGMRLQTDVSVIYGLGPAFDGDLTRADLRRDTPYNSYRRAGLPPTPIAFPGAAALSAAAHPEPGAWRYFVARGDGTSVFSVTLADHERAVDRYQRQAAAKGRAP